MTTISDRKLKFALGLVLFLAASFLFAAPADGAVSDWQQAVSIYSRWDSDFASATFEESVRNAKAAGADHVTLTFPYYQTNPWSTDLGRGWNTPTDAALRAGIRYVRSQGMGVTLKPHVENYDGQWRAVISPGDRDAWYGAYGAILRELAGGAQAEGVSQMVIGSELIKMAAYTENSGNTAAWHELIDQVRGIFGGQLTYSANWGESGWVEEVNKIAFWDRLDYIGISAYYNLYTSSNDPASLAGAWNGWDSSRIEPISRQFGKRVLFTEIGYKSVSGSHTRPWDYWYGGPADETEQANAYEALFSYWNGRSYLAGVHLWDWSSDPNAGWPGNPDYTPQHKRAEDVMRAWWSGAGTPPPPPPAVPASFAIASAGAAPANPASGGTVDLSVSLRNDGGAVSDIIVDLEIWDAAGGKVFQRYFEGQSFSAGETKSYGTSWSAAAEGSYSFKVGVFGPGWSQVHLWANEAAVIRAGGSEPPSASGRMEIWWPTDGVTLSGTQPFKGILSGWDISRYVMFWQVDGDVLNPMGDGIEDYPHKEALVDVSSWNWKDAGPYLLNFLARDPAGNELGSKEVSIKVSR